MRPSSFMILTRLAGSSLCTVSRWCINRTPSRHLPGLGLMMSQMYWPTFFWLFQPPGGRAIGPRQVEGLRIIQRRRLDTSRGACGPFH